MNRTAELICEIVCKIVLGILVVFAVVVSLIRGVGVLVAITVMFARSPLPWWILAPAAIFLVAGLVYLLKRRLDRRRPVQTISK